MSTTVVTLGHLFKQDLEKAYLFPVFPSSYLTNSKFVNKDKYCVYDYPPSKMLRDILYPQAMSCIVGNEIPVLTDYPPPEFLKQHWEKWLPVFPLPSFISTDEGLREDGIPVITMGPFQEITRSKHSVDPDVLQFVQLKSSIPEIGVPHPRYMDEDNIEFPCVIKVDLSYFGRGVYRANNIDELTVLVKEIREKHGWKSKIIYQELIQDIKRILSHVLYLSKTGDAIWLGTGAGTYAIDTIKYTQIFDWKEQEKERLLVYDEFAIPIVKFLSQKGYFGIVNFEIIESDSGERCLIDLNSRLPGEISHFFIAPYMASLGLVMSELQYAGLIPGDISATKLVETANQLNHVQDGTRVIINSFCADEKKQWSYHISVFGKTKSDCQTLWNKLGINS